MILDLSKVKIFIRPGVTDMRKQINGLSVIVEEDMNLTAMKGALFIFCNRGRRLIKCIYWDRNGFCLWLKRLEKDRFPWPDTEEQVQELNLEELNMLLSGIDFWKAHKEIHYTDCN